METKKIIITIICVCILIIGAIAWCNDIFVSNFSLKKEAPLYDPEGIVVSESGNVFCGLMWSQRVQVYSKNGVFIKGIPIAAAGGTFKLKLDSQNHLNVATARNDMLYIFDENGILLSKKEIIDIYDSFDSIDQYCFFDRNMSKYAIKNSFAFPHIVETSPKGKSKTIVHISFLYWLFMMPFPGILFVLIGVLTLNWMYNEKFRRRIREFIDEAHGNY